MDTLKRLLKYFFRYSYLLIPSLILSVISVAISLYIPILIGNAIDNMIEEGEVFFDSIYKYLIYIMICVILVSLINLLLSTLNNHMCYKTTSAIRRDAFNKLHSLPLSYIDSNPHGVILNTIITDIDVINEGLRLMMDSLFISIFTIIGTIIFMIRINIYIAILIILLSPLSIFISKFISTKSYKMFKEQEKSKASETRVLNEAITNIKLISSINKEEYMVNRFNDVDKDLEKKSVKAIFFSSLTNPSTRFINAIIYACVGVVSSIISISFGTISVGNISSLLAYSNQYTKPFNDITLVISEIQNALACAARVFKFLDEAEEESDEESIDTPISNNASIEIKDLYFSYNKSVPLIQNFNLNVKSGEHIAIVGPTGAGKSTIINLLMRFYDVDEGEIKIGENNINLIKRKSLRQNFGMVLQDTWIRSDTVLNNLLLDNTDNVSKDTVIEVCKKCHCHSFISNLPLEYDTMLSEDGGALSTGQKQLLCIARVMLQNPNMLILDEATSNVDSLTEKNINSAFDELMKGRTSFVVAHRLSTILSSDKIIVMNNGQIIEVGKHEELLQKKGFYYNLYNSQFSN